MSRLSLATLLLITTFLTACQSKYGDEMPADFSFKIESVDGSSSYDSSTGQFILKYLAGDSLVYAPLTMETKRAIYQEFCKADFMRFPDEFLCNPLEEMTLPSFPTLLTINYHGESKKVYGPDKCGCIFYQWFKFKRFEELTDLIRSRIYGQDVIQKMRPSDIMYE
ncbi:hypothetical protein [Siphonobacter sp. SORGH_AS_0500]|uniref:hypothetical protein n=1 Tax=Siphonobacter sp. SORGH_AS_0500 TaxID=1864824 RepID=UPI00285FD033|nr:hypothetical protein [Siphonobacter sp. SORGH_AS_0500]MDR6194923.1 hypothetical protein [Siphonobacter sp. SORGH_AS_0500]